LAEKYDDEEIAQRLNGEGLTSSTGKPFTVSIVRWIRFKHRIPGPLLPTGTLTVSQVCERYGVSLWVVHYWIERGVVSAVQRKPNTPYAIVIDNAVDRRLRKWVASSGHLHPSSHRANRRSPAGPLSRRLRGPSMAANPQDPSLAATYWSGKANARKGGFMPT
jgi:hypothetical protein